MTELVKTAYFVPGIRLEPETGGSAGVVAHLPARRSHHLVREGEQIILTRELTAWEPVAGGPHRIGCSLSQVFDDALPGQRILFDDGKISGVITESKPSGTSRRSCWKPCAGGRSAS